MEEINVDSLDCQQEKELKKQNNMSKYQRSNITEKDLIKEPDQIHRQSSFKSTWAAEME